MPGNKTIFNDAMKKGHNAAWDRQWAVAVKEYQRALVEFPQDAFAHLGLAHAFEEVGEIERAAHECRIASKMQPHDSVPLALLAALLVKLGKPSDAVASFLAVAEIHVANKAMGKAVEAWQKVVALEPERIEVHRRLAEAYEQGSHLTLAAKEFIAIAKVYQKRGDAVKAAAAAQKAISLDSQSSVSLSRIANLARTDATGPQSASPVDQAEQAALSRLAETVLESKQPVESTNIVRLSASEIDALITRAVDAQSQHRTTDAIVAYRKLLSAGVTRSEVKFNLGLLYSETMRYDDAINLLNDTVSEPNYALASQFALGKCYRAMGKMDQSVEQYLLAIKTVDAGSVERDQADELISAYEGLAESYAAKGDRAKSESFSRALESVLTSKGWEDKLREARVRLQSLNEEGAQISLADVIEVPHSNQVLESLALAQEYLRRGKTRAAGDECMRAIELVPNYLPAHLRLAEVRLKEGLVAEAKEKYQTLAELSSARDDLKRAQGFYQQLVKISPSDVGSRSKIIDLAIQQNRFDVALEQYLELGDEEARAGKLAKAAERFAEGIRVALREGDRSDLALTLRHRYAEVKSQSGDYKSALLTYQEIKKNNPADERARVQLIDLHYRMNQANAALVELEELLSGYRERGETQKVTDALEDLVNNFPKEPALRARLAHHLILQGKNEQAVEALDALGEMQLSAGNKKAAAATIRQIISMNPPRVEEYNELLAQLSE